MAMSVEDIIRKEVLDFRYNDGINRVQTVFLSYEDKAQIRRTIGHVSSAIDSNNLAAQSNSTHIRMMERIIIKTEGRRMLRFTPKEIGKMKGLTYQIYLFQRLSYRALALWVDAMNHFNNLLKEKKTNSYIAEANYLFDHAIARLDGVIHHYLETDSVVDQAIEEEIMSWRILEEDLSLSSDDSDTSSEGSDTDTIIGMFNDIMEPDDMMDYDEFDLSDDDTIEPCSGAPSPEVEEEIVEEIVEEEKIVDRETVEKETVKEEMVVVEEKTVEKETVEEDVIMTEDVKMTEEDVKMTIEKKDAKESVEGKSVEGKSVEGKNVKGNVKETVEERIKEEINLIKAFNDTFKNPLAEQSDENDDDKSSEEKPFSNEPKTTAQELAHKNLLSASINPPLEELPNYEEARKAQEALAAQKAIEKAQWEKVLAKKADIAKSLFVKSIDTLAAFQKALRMGGDEPLSRIDYLRTFFKETNVYRVKEMRVLFDNLHLYHKDYLMRVSDSVLLWRSICTADLEPIYPDDLRSDL